MPRFWKRFKKYEKWILLGLTILLLASFNVVGVANCARNKAQEDYSGSFEVAPGQRKTVSGEEFGEVFSRYRPFLRNFGPSFRNAMELGRAEDLGDEQATWAHIVVVEAAKAAGYRVGADELSDEIKRFVSNVGSATRRGRGSTPLGFSEELYEQIVQDHYRGSKPDFEKTFGEVLLKDKFLAPLIDAERFSRSRHEGYDAWKASRERVNLRYVAAKADQFDAVVKPEEETRSAVAKQEDVLQKVASAAQRVRGLDFYLVEKWKPAHGGAFPKDGDELAKDGGAMPWNEDGWGNKLEYRLAEGKPLVFSKGPDGKADTEDDVGPDAVKRIQTLATLRLTANALVEWRKATKAWPESLEALTKAPPAAPGGAATVPPMTAVSKDDWDHALVYESAGPVLLSMGPDGQRGTADDLTASVAEDGASVPLPAAFDAYLQKDLKDAWGRPLASQFKTASPWTFEVASAGKDGVAGDDDDVKQGNGQDLAVFYNRVRNDHTLPDRHEFEAIWVHLPLVPDDTFKALWAKYKDYRPTEDAKKDEGYDRWRDLGGSEPDRYYRTEEVDEAGKKTPVDPADPVKGCGADLITEEMKKAGSKGWLVPAPETLGEQKDPPKPPPPLAGTIPQEDPLRKAYLEKGWRRVLLREMFFEHFLAALLNEAIESQKQHDKWIADGKRDKEPDLVTFEQQIARFKDEAPGVTEAAAGGKFLEYFRTEPDKPLKMKEWEALPGVGDAQVTFKLNPLAKDGEYSSLPIVTRRSAGRVLLRNLKFHRERTPELDEVRADVWPKYLESRAMDRAQKELEKVKAAVKGDADRIDVVAKDVAAQGGWTFEAGETGTFVGRVFQPDLPVPKDLTKDPKDPARLAEAETIRRRSYVRSDGYREVDASGSGQDAIAAKPGQVARRVLRDESKGEAATGCAYLVQVISQEYPTLDEFSGRRYLDWLSEAAYGKASAGRSAPLVARDGFMYAAVYKFFADYDSIVSLFDLQTARHPSDQKYQRPKRR